jgi:sugar phosphate permease
MEKKRFFPWLLIVLGSFFVLYQFLLQSANSVMIEPLQTSFNVGLTDIGFLSASFFYTYVFLQIPAGLLVDRFGARMLMTLGCTICALAAILFGCVTHFNQAVYMRLLMGLASSPAVVGVMYLACRWFPREKFALLASVVEMIGMLGGAIGEPSLANLVAKVGWRTSMIWTGVVGLILSLCIVLVVRNQPKIKIAADCKKIPTKELWHTFIQALKHRAVWLGCLYGAFSFSVISGFGGLWAIPFLQDVHGLDVTKSAFISSMIFIGASLGAGSAGYLACYKLNIKSLMVTASIVSMLCMLAILFIAKGFFMNAVLFLLLGLSAGFYALSFAYVKINTCESIGASAMGLTNMMCLLLGAPLLQPLVGHFLAYLTALGKSPIMIYRLGMLPFLLTTVLGLGIALMIKKPEEKKYVK